MIYPGLGYRWVFDQNWGIREQEIGVPTQTCGFNWTNRAVYSITNNNLMYNTTANQTKGAVVISVEQELGACVPQKTVFKQQTWEQKLGLVSHDGGTTNSKRTVEPKIYRINWRYSSSELSVG